MHDDDKVTEIPTSEEETLSGNKNQEAEDDDIEGNEADADAHTEEAITRTAHVKSHSLVCELEKCSV